MRKTKIVCTVGPSIDNVEALVKMIESGMNVARLNFSHAVYDVALKHIANIRAAEKQVGKTIGIMLDTKGPEIRTGQFDMPEVLLEEGQTFTITMKDVMGNKEMCTVSYKGLAKDVVPGNTILIDDGLVGLRVDEVNGDDIVCTVENSGIVKNHKGVNVPGVKINLPALLLPVNFSSNCFFISDNSLVFIVPSFKLIIVEAVNPLVRLFK